MPVCVFTAINIPTFRHSRQMGQAPFNRAPWTKSRGEGLKAPHLLTLIRRHFIPRLETNPLPSTPSVKEPNLLISNKDSRIRDNWGRLNRTAPLYTLHTDLPPLIDTLHPCFITLSTPFARCTRSRSAKPSNVITNN
jgi:hypothetical protein